MGQVGKYLRKQHGGWAHYCPGCEEIHHYPVDEPHPNGSRWQFDGNMEKPSFTPSMNIGPDWCHYYLTKGMLIFSACSGHGLGGKTMPLPELPPEYRD